jgi:hypothetical protein
MEAAEQEGVAVRLESLLARAIEAEARGDLAEAEKVFRLALFDEAKLRPDVTDVAAYVRSAGPLFPGLGLAAGLESGAASPA